MDIILLENGERGYFVYKEILKTPYKIKLIVKGKEYYEFQKEISNCKLIFFEDINNKKSIKYLSNLNADIFLVAGFSQIFRKEVLEIPKFGTINLHAGKLPYYRGGSPLNWQLINGEDKVGLSAILMDEGIDTGNILAEIEFPIKTDDDIASLHKKSNSLFPEIAINAITKLSEGNKGKMQKINEGSYWHQRQDKDGEICFDKLSANKVHLLIKSLNDPYPNAWAKLNGRKIRFKKSEVPDICIKGKPGKIFYLQDRGPFIICKDKALLINEYLDEKDQKFVLKNNMYFS